MSTFECCSLGFDVILIWILLLERYRGKPDVVVRNEAKQRKRLRVKPDFEELNIREMK